MQHNNDDAVEQISEIRKLDFDWVVQFKALKVAYDEAKVAKGEQVFDNATWISQGIVLTPDLERLIRLYEGAVEGSPLGDPTSIGNVTGQWRAIIRW